MRRRRRSRLTKKESEAAANLLLVGVGVSIVVTIINAVFVAVASVFESLRELLKEPIWALTAIGVIATWGYFFRKRYLGLQKVREQRQVEMEKVSIDTDRLSYVISNDDYRRGSAQENLYRRLFKLVLLEKYENRCAKCGDQGNGVDIDHFVFSKNEGGNFILKHKNGFFVNNAIPLCVSCNRGKSDRSFSDFFDSEELLRIFRINAQMTKLLNETIETDENGKVTKVKSKRAV